MGFKAVYNCDICRDHIPKTQLVGCNFSTLKKFRLSGPETTQGVHICGGCLQQIAEQAPPFLPIVLPTQDKAAEHE